MSKESDLTNKLSKMNWGIDGHKLLISPKFMAYLNGLVPGPDQGLLVSLFSMVHFLSEMLDKEEPSKMKSAQYQPAVHIMAPIPKRDGKISDEGLREFTRVIGKKYPQVKKGKDYETLMALADMSNNPVGQKPVWYKLSHTAVPVGDCLIDLNDHCKIVQKIRTFAYMNHYQVTFKMNTGEVGAGCLDLPSKPKIAKEE